MVKKANAVAFTMILILGALIGFLVPKMLFTSRGLTHAASADTEACKLERERPRRPEIRMVSSYHERENGEYVRFLEVSSGAAYDLFWYLESSDPPLVSGAGGHVFRLGSSPVKLEFLPSKSTTLKVGRRYTSYAMLDLEPQEAAAIHPVKGQYPLAADSVVAQLNGDHIAGGSHLSSEGRGNAVDLQTTVGTQVLAFGAGLVVAVEDGYDDRLRCGPSHAPEYANVVVVLQDDGYEAIYGHLQMESSLVSEGMRIAKGQPLANVGEFTASEMGPHLHFQLGGMTGRGPVSVRVAFEDKDARSRSIPKLGQHLHP